MINGRLRAIAEKILIGKKSCGYLEDKHVEGPGRTIFPRWAMFGVFSVIKAKQGYGQR